MVSNVVAFPVIKPASKKIAIIPSLFIRVVDALKKKSDDIRRKKIDVLIRQAYQYYYDLLETLEASDVDIPQFIYEEQRKRCARAQANKAVLEILRNNRLEYCYQLYKKQFKKSIKK